MAITYLFSLEKKMKEFLWWKRLLSGHKKETKAAQLWAKEENNGPQDAFMMTAGQPYGH